MTDLKAKNGFPTDIDRTKDASIMIGNDWTNYVLLYVQKNGDMHAEFGITDIHWEAGIYWLKGI